MNRWQQMYRETGLRAHRAEPVITRLMTEALAKPDLLSLAAGFTDNALLPKDLIHEAVAAIGDAESANGYLQYGMNQGRPGLREGVLKMLSRYPGEHLEGLSGSNVLICNGSQQALYISIQLFCQPGDIVLVEQPSYFVFLELLKGLGVGVRGIPLRDDGGNDWKALEHQLQSAARTGELERIRMMYLMGAYANPSTRCLCRQDRLELAGLLHRLPRPLPLIEDMAYRELHFGAIPADASCIGQPEFEGLPVLYCGTFTKPFATGFKIGFAVSRETDWIRDMATVKGHQDFGSPHLPQAILDWVIANNRYEDHLNAIKIHYERKMKRLVGALEEGGIRELGWDWAEPFGGLLLWVKGPEFLDTRIGSGFHKACMESGVLYVPGDLCFPSGSRNSHCVRLSFGAIAESKIAEATRRFCEAARDSCLALPTP